MEYNSGSNCASKFKIFYEYEARGQFEIMSMITHWIVRHEVQYKSITKFEIENSFGKFFWAKTSVALFISVENCAKLCEKIH